MAKRLIDILKEYDKTKIAFHMPGHHRNMDFCGGDFLRDLGANMDVTELYGLDDLHEPLGILKEAMERAAKLWGAHEAYYLVNGSSGGNLAALYSLLNRGDRVLLARNCHKSIYHGIELMDVKVNYINPKIDKNFGISLGIDPHAVEEMLKKFPDTKLLVVTSPTYEGLVSDIGAISKVCKAYGVKLFVDEAHGAHLGLSPYFPPSAISQGADMVVKSLHKSLASLTQTAILLTNGAVDRDRLRHALAIFQSSSPSYILMASIDANIDILSRKGSLIFSEWSLSLKEFYRDMKSLKHLRLMTREDLWDYSKIVIFTGQANISAHELAQILRGKYMIEPEMTSRDYAIAYTGIGMDRTRLKLLAKALFDIDGGLKAQPAKEYDDLGSYEEVEPIKEAISKDRILVDFEASLGEEAAEYVWIYPPGIPLLIPGQRVSEEDIKLLSSYREANLSLRFSNNHDENRIYIVANK